MVSFFGLKFRGDRKKSQKAQDKQQQQQQQQKKWDRIDQNTLGKDQYFGHNFSRPSLAVPASLRPGTACAGTTAPAARTWRAVFGNPGAATSMTDLKPPVMSNLRHNASEVSLRSHRAAQDCTAGLTTPGGSGVRPGSSTAPDASKSDWVNPVDANLCRDASSVRPGAAPATKAALPCRLPPFGKLDLNMEALMDEPLGASKSKADDGVGASGYPSPPQSDGVSERSYFPYHPSIGRVSPDSRPSSRCNAPSALRNVDTAAIGACPPSPAPSPPCTRDGPDPLALGLQRRRTFKLDYDDQPTIKKKQHVEGFSGNFADFDFGATVSRPGESPDSARCETHNGAQSKVDQWLRQPENPKARLPCHASAPSLSGMRPTTATAPFPQPPSTICEESEFGGASLASSVESDPKLGSGGAAVPGQSFPARIDSKHRLPRAPPPQALGPMPPLLSMDQVKPSLPSPYGPSAEGEGNYVRNADLELPRRPSDLPPVSPLGRRPMAGDFPKSKGGLPRGRLLEPPVMPLSGSSDGEEESDNEEGHETDDEDTGPILPAWPSFDNASHRHSAVPPPLSTLTRSPARSTASSTPSTAAPRLPSPTFPSLTTSISGSSLDLARSFELALAESLGSGLGSPLDRIPSASSGLGSCGGSPTRVEAKKAPPRPEVPVTLPPSLSDRVGALPLRSRTEGAAAAGFI
ncbi:hypothetical protein HRG_006836 [Hirsutella rhossiliensis]|uniref:Uncharacterized protein n=1 Tax=Hirsutella rhossiliensis TaxID=111463 RepID=A0A9P8SGG3_9HYPO|nr:uncharacterized protein HRG_06836 [Hirsutella rhossiliensis]KAH0961756.1 hypothetical protein HRG_06836 [Hirsutella rhossiliensis]